MFKTIQERMQRAQKARDKARRESDRATQQAQAEAARAKALDDEREQRIRAIRVLSGDIPYRYAILDALRTVGYAEFEGNQLIDPDAATRRAIGQLQDLAFSIGADAIINAQYQVVRYAVQGRQSSLTPVYETHIFGTAIRIVGPPPEWQETETEL